MELPFVHRFDILTSGGVNYIIACALKSDHEYKDDWRFPGKIWVGVLPDDLSGVDEDHQIELTVLKDGLLKNHGYCRVEENGQVWAGVAADNGIFKVVPPAEKGGEWTVETLTGGRCQRYDLCRFRWRRRAGNAGNDSVPWRHHQDLQESERRLYLRQDL